jgi:hypothetical protein
MTEQEPDAADYGYDMAHEARAYGRPGGVTASQDAQPLPRATARPRGASDSDGDMSYDEAHDF